MSTSGENRVLWFPERRGSLGGGLQIGHVTRAAVTHFQLAGINERCPFSCWQAERGGQAGRLAGAIRRGGVRGLHAASVAEESRVEYGYGRGCAQIIALIKLIICYFARSVS